MAQNLFYILGSSSGLPQAGRATAGYLLKTGDSLSLIDCGGGVTGSFLKRGLNPLDVDRIFISHTHPDHVCELPLFLQLIYLRGREEPVDLYLPEEFVEPFKQYMKAVYLIVEKLPFKIRFHPVTDDFTFFNDSFQLTSHPNNHLLGNKDYIEKLNLPNKMQCFSYKIKVGEKKIFYSADIGTFDDIKDHLDGCEFVIIESTHINLDDFFSFVNTISVGQFIITHLGSEEEIAEISRQAEQAGMNNMMIAMDGMELYI